MLPAPEKPTLRGVSHAIACLLALIAGVWLVDLTHTERAHTAVALYVGTLVLMFAVSALYHILNWSSGLRKWWRRLDHAAIYVLIAGTATPFCQLVLPPDAGRRLLITMWIGAAIGVGKSVVWVGAPKKLSAVLYVILGCLAVPYLP